MCVYINENKNKIMQPWHYNPQSNQRGGILWQKELGHLLQSRMHFLGSIEATSDVSVHESYDNPSTHKKHTLVIDLYINTFQQRTKAALSNQYNACWRFIGTPTPRS